MSFEEVGGSVELWTHRRSLLNGGGTDQGICGSCDIANYSHTLLESLIDMRKLLSFERFGKAGVSFGKQVLMSIIDNRQHNDNIDEQR